MIFALVYLTLCPAAILYALGYSWDSGQPFHIVKTGLIYLVSAPSGAAVRLDGRDLGRTTPALLSNLAPGDHAVELQLEGRRVWRETAPVEAEKATVFQKVLLLPGEWRPARLPGGPWDDLYSIGDGEGCLLVRSTPAFEMRYFDLRKEKSFEITAPFGLSARLVSVRTAPESSRALLEIEKEGKTSWYGLRTGPEDATLEDWTEFIGEGPAEIEWEGNDGALFVWRAGALSRVQPERRQAEKLPLESVHGFGLRGRALYYLDAKGALTSVNGEGGSPHVLFNDPELGEALFGETDLFHIRFLDKETVLFWDRNGELLSNRLPYRFVKEGVEGFEWESKNRKLLIRQKGRLGIVDLARREAPQGLFERGASLVWIYRGDRIRQAHWVYDGSHILLLDDHRLRLIDLETYGRPGIDEVAEVKRNTSCLWSEKTGKLHYLDPAGNLEVLDLVPSRGLLELPFIDQRRTKSKGEIRAL